MDDLSAKRARVKPSMVNVLPTKVTRQSYNRIRIYVYGRRMDAYKDSKDRIELSVNKEDCKTVELNVRPYRPYRMPVVLS